ncbi:MAG: 2-oxoacid:ferredoxin oxidoreductase subunit alpha [Thermoplasmataceae archaeon]
MPESDISIVIGGPQGGGIDTSATMIGRAFAYSGMNVISVREFHSNIKGRHSYVHLRARKDVPRSLKFPADLLIALDPDTIFEHFEDVGKGTKIIYDSSFENSDLNQARMIMRDTSKKIKNHLETGGYPLTVKGMLEAMKARGGIPIAVSFDGIISEVIKDGTNARYYNTLGAAITLSIVGIPEEFIIESIKYVFGSKEKVISPNIEVVKSAYRFSSSKSFASTPTEKVNRIPKLMLTGNDGAALGKLMGGLRFQTYYPITPASDESSAIEEHQAMEWIGGESSSLEKGGVTVVQTEDEISAITMACGAALTGSRSATATSGPGFSLMAEAISFAGMDEIPVVVTLYQRGGPSTGLPTRNSQSDLLFALNTGHGEFPRIVISSGDVEECIYDAMKALNYAQRYQLPVIHLIDKNLANTTQLVDSVDAKKVKVEGPAIAKSGPDFKRYDLNTKNGISKTGYFGRDIFWMTGDEHDELGHVTEDPDMRDSQMEKRFRKMETADREIPVEDKVEIIGDKKAEITLVTWGSQKGVAQDVAQMFAKKGVKIKILYLKMFEPFPSDFVLEVLSKSKTVIDLESNMLGQAAQVIRMKTGFKIENQIVKYNGRHITEDELYEGIEKIMSGKTKKVVLRNGA